MAQSFKEKAHLNINQDKYNENYDRIFRTKNKSLYVETSNETEEPGEREIQELQVSENLKGSSEQEE